MSKHCSSGVCGNNNTFRTFPVDCPSLGSAARNTQRPSSLGSFLCLYIFPLSAVAAVAVAPNQPASQPGIVGGKIRNVKLVVARARSQRWREYWFSLASRLKGCLSHAIPTQLYGAIAFLLM